MQFHFFKPGESLLSIAREYGVSPARLIEDNAITDPDRPADGECFVIYRHSRTYTVRGGDSVPAISKRFAKDARALYALNPSIRKNKLLYPGQILSLGGASPMLGAIFTLAFADLSSSIQDLAPFSSALTYLAITPCFDLSESEFHEESHAKLLSFCKENGIVPLLVCTLSAPLDGNALTAALTRIGTCGYGGILLRPVPGAEAYLGKIKQRGLIAAYFGEEGDTHSLSQAADLIVRMPRSPEESFASLTARLSGEYDSDLLGKLIPCIPPFGSVRENGIDIAAPYTASPARLAYRRNTGILRLEDGRPAVRYRTLERGKETEYEIRFEDPFSIQKGLAEIGESGLGGVGLEIPNIHPAIGIQISSCFDIIHP